MLLLETKLVQVQEQEPKWSTEFVSQRRRIWMKMTVPGNEVKTWCIAKIQMVLIVWASFVLLM